MNNLVKVEGYKTAIQSDVKVKFIAVIDGKETDMCHSLDGQEFNVNDWNEFDRYYGETANELRLSRIRCKGLMLGLNLPPISHHFHWCRSTIMYLNNNKNDGKIDKVPKEKIHNNNEKNNLSIEDIKNIANKINDIVSKYTNNESKWSGNIVIGEDDTNAKLWNCDIEVSPKLQKNEIEHVLLHEQLHAHSISYYDKETFHNFRSIEEATIELYTKEIDKLENIKSVPSGYDDMVNNLLKINDKLKIEEDNFKFAKTLFNTPVADRLNFLENKISAYVADKTIDEAMELNKLMEVLYE